MRVRHQEDVAHADIPSAVQRRLGVSAASSDGRWRACRTAASVAFRARGDFWSRSARAFCAARGIVSEIEMIRADQIDAAYERMVKSDVKYRFVIDCASMG